MSTEDKVETESNECAPKTLYKNPESHTYMDKAVVDSHTKRVLNSFFSGFGIEPGARVLEVGAGFGRFTSYMSQMPIHLTTSDADPKFVEILRKNFSEREPLLGSNVAVKQIDISKIDSNFLSEFDYVCGFHILHHLDQKTLHRFKGELAKSKNLKGWMFLEPNRFNPLYIIQTALFPSMHFRDEIGIWKYSWRKIFKGSCQKMLIGHLGLLPPSRRNTLVSNLFENICSRLIVRNASFIKKIFFAYVVVGDCRSKTKA